MNSTPEQIAKEIIEATLIDHSSLGEERYIRMRESKLVAAITTALLNEREQCAKISKEILSPVWGERVATAIRKPE